MGPLGVFEAERAVDASAAKCSHAAIDSGIRARFCRASQGFFVCAFLLVLGPETNRKYVRTYEAKHEAGGCTLKLR